MASPVDQRHRTLVPRGYHYTVIKGFAGLRAGERVRILNTYFGSNKEDSGFVVIFPDRDPIRLHRRTAAKIIANISDYLRQDEPFDLAAAQAEYDLRVARARDEWKREESERTEAERDAVSTEVKRSGLSPKEAYRLIKKSRN